MIKLFKVFLILFISIISGIVLGHFGIYPIIASIVAFVLLVAHQEAKVTKESYTFLNIDKKHM